MARQVMLYAAKIDAISVSPYSPYKKIQYTVVSLYTLGSRKAMFDLLYAMEGIDDEGLRMQAMSYGVISKDVLVIIL